MIKGKSIILTTIFFITLCGAILVPLLATAGSLEPSAAPAPTMRTLDEIYNKLDSLATKPRFQVVLSNDVAVLDNNTGLMWERSTMYMTSRSWDDANTYCNDSSLGGRYDWRLPTKDELLSLVDTTQINPALPLGHPFLDALGLRYWSSTTYADGPSNAWFVYFYSGISDYNPKFLDYLVRCVRP